MPARIVIKKPPPDPPKDEGLPPWMATFADMVTLLLCFFVLMLSFANQDLEKFKEMLGSIHNAFGVVIERPEAPHVAFAPSRYQRKEITLNNEGEILLGIVLRLKDLLKNVENKVKSTGVVADRDGVLLHVDSGSLFEPGTVRLKPDAGKVLDQVVTVLKEHNLDLVVRGHTDPGEYKGTPFPSNWELSSARAAAALEYIMDKGGIPPTRLKAVGYADTRPLVANDSTANREKNRRVEFYYHRPERDAW